MDLRFRLLLVTFVGLIVAAVWTFPFWRPYFIDQGVSEFFPGLALDQQAAFLALPESEKDALLEMYGENPEVALQMVQAMLVGDTEAPEDAQTDDMSQTITLRSGTFGEIDVLHWAQGTATVYQLPDQRRLLLLEDFISARGVELHVVLSREPDPAAGGVGVDYIDLGRLKGTRGNQSYTVPESVDLNRYVSVVIYCVPLNAIVSVATLG